MSHSHSQPPETPASPVTPVSPDTGVHHEHVVPIAMYLLIYAALMLLLVATVGAYYVDLGPANTALSLLIAAVKASLVVLFFMHVKYSSRMTWLFAAAGLAWLAVMVTLTLGDYLTRGWLVPGH